MWSVRRSLTLARQYQIHVGSTLDRAGGQFGRQQHLLPVASSQGLTEEDLARTFAHYRSAVVRVGSVDVVHPLVDGIVDHPGGERGVDILVMLADDRQTHGPEAEDRDPLPGLAERAIEHGVSLDSR